MYIHVNIIHSFNGQYQESDLSVLKMKMSQVNSNCSEI